MKKSLKVVIISTLLFSITGIFGATNVKADYVHTYKQESLAARGKVMSVVTDPGAYLYEFTPVKNRALAANSDWYTDKGSIPYDDAANPKWRVATNEWVSSSDVAYVHTEDKGAVLTNSSKEIYSFNPKSFSFSATGRYLPLGDWYVGKTITVPSSGILPNYGQVGKNEWINLNDGY